jgi:hypothetical protein
VTRARRPSRVDDVVREIATRKLSTLEDCEVAWEQGRDPLALAVAVTKAGLPLWLEVAIRALVMDGWHHVEARRALAVPRSLARAAFLALWRRREQDAWDARVAFDVAAQRKFRGLTWVKSYLAAMRRGPVPQIEADGHAAERARTTYRRVARRIAENPGRYWWVGEDFWSGDDAAPK